MKRFFLVLFSSVILYSSWAQTYSVEELTRASQQFMSARNPELTIRATDTLLADSNLVVGFLFRFAPKGFVIVSFFDNIRPIYGYSVTDNFLFQGNDGRLARKLISKDLQYRIWSADLLPRDSRIEIAREWELFKAGVLFGNPFQQWPPEGTTITGGWLNTNWTQSAPYNTMCPMDLNAGSRSVAGCPAIAMAQIVNYHEDINNTLFDDSDDYYHNYGAGNQYWIDNDHETWGFPSFDSLNTWLESLGYAYQCHLPVSNEMKAALCFASGIAAHQVYSASVSGTFGIEQAYEAFQRFDFAESRLAYPTDTNLNYDIAENMKVALPVQLGLICDPGPGGHNVVVDGYNTYEYYHFNFGWGGSANGWYTLPPTGIPYNLTIIEGAVLDIKSDNFTSDQVFNIDSLPIRLYPNPVISDLFIQSRLPHASLILYNSAGKRIHDVPIDRPVKKLSLDQLTPGLYFIHVIQHNHVIFTGKIIKK